MSDAVSAAGYNTPEAQAAADAEQNVQDYKKALMGETDPKRLLALSFDLMDATNKKTIIVESMSKVDKAEIDGQKSAIQSIA